MPTSTTRTLEIFHQANAILEHDHFVYGNGDHGSGWIAKDRILPYPDLLDELGSLLADAVRPLNAEVICAPAMGGMIIGQWTARHLGVPMVFAEREVKAENLHQLHKPFELKRGFREWVQDRRVLLVDDIVSTGYSVSETAKTLVGAKEIVGVAALITRGNVTAAELGMGSFIYLAQVDIPTWTEGQCPVEILNRPVNTQYAHGAEYLAAKE